MHKEEEEEEEETALLPSAMYCSYVRGIALYNGSLDYSRSVKWRIQMIGLNVSSEQLSISHT